MLFLCHFNKEICQRNKIFEKTKWDTISSLIKNEFYIKIKILLQH
ncbi:hypothetical protein FLAVO9AF_570003 [Flavobacterium sp. 9AF]|nr:hypothetical protein FLAVO9AF_570003 [Flavobacterium sp. 9AF]